MTDGRKNGFASSPRTNLLRRLGRTCFVASDELASHKQPGEPAPYK
ncbi:hypothetical protein [Bacteroides hominis]|nr:hypothetical protein [Bacteroides hominis (ex Liu et al. 2022)]MDV6185857.1 hypothetical protein [Bacteroides hominis (ex Liu et al. 2022)]